MASFRLDSIAQLARQMQFTPQETRSAQLLAAERLLLEVSPQKAYPLEYVVYRITGYHPKTSQAQLLTGLAIQHDLGLLVELVSATLGLRIADIGEPVLDIDDVCLRFSVTSKTIQRWRRRGLAARRITFADGRPRVAFLLSSVERFVAAHQDQVAHDANIQQAGPQELDAILRHARRLVGPGDCCVSTLTRRIARRVNRSPLAILHLLRKHDQENPGDAILSRAAAELTDRQKAIVAKAFRRGANLRRLARRLGLGLASVYDTVLADRVARVMKRRVRFIDDPLYHQDEAAETVNAIVAAEDLSAENAEDVRVPRDLPPYFQDLYRTPLLSPARERALFLKLNYLKCRFVTARRRLDPERVRSRDLGRLEGMLEDATNARNALVRANLRLVVSVARKHLRNGVSLMELASEGNIVLMRAVDSYDAHRGHRFSTYATLALMKGFARAVPQMLYARRPLSVDVDLLAELPDSRPMTHSSRMADRDEVRQLLSRLNGREQSILSAHFGLDERDAPQTYEQLGQQLGLSKERVRQIERDAILKLRQIMGL